MEAWTLVIWGLIALPAVGMVAVLADLVSAYRDMVIVQLAGAGQVEREQAKHTLLAQVARGAMLALFANIAVWEITDLLNRRWLALFFYMIVLVGIADAWRARQARKRMIRLIEKGTP